MKKWKQMLAITTAAAMVMSPGSNGSGDTRYKKRSRGCISEDV